jgi:diguanylate cyclase
MMSWTIILGLFCGGIAVGLFLPYLAKAVNLHFFRDLLASFARLFKNKKQKEAENPLPKVDPREQQINDSAQAVRTILLSLAALFQRTGDAAGRSSTTLGEVRSHMDAMVIPSDLSEVHNLLIREIDRMILTNNHLKEELAQAREDIETQRRQIENLKTAVRIDGLTQLANRTFFNEKLMEVIRLIKRYGNPFSLLMIDVDDFKRVNDSQGHQAGDRLLKGVAVKLKASVRGSDFIARYGGDEFAIILYNTRMAEALEVGWKICRFLREGRFLLDGKEFWITLSVGGTEVSRDDTPESLIERADKALYLAKEKGRNRVESIPPAPPVDFDPTLFRSGGPDGSAGEGRVISV